MVNSAYGDWISFDGIPYTEADTRISRHIEIIRAKDYVVMQYTGLKDKNGKEIYESDVIKWGGETVPVFVIWSEKFASFGLRRDGWMHTHFFGEAVDHSDCEVIGNIWQNHELVSN